MSGQNLAWKDFRNRMKEKRRGGKRKPYYRYRKLPYVIDTRINQVFKKYTYVT